MNQPVPELKPVYDRMHEAFAQERCGRAEKIARQALGLPGLSPLDRGRLYSYVCRAKVRRRFFDQEAAEFGAQAVELLRRHDGEPDRPHLGLALENWALALCHSGRFAAAEKAYRECLAVTPDPTDQVPSLLGLAWTYLLQRQPRRALQVSRRAGVQAAQAGNTGLHLPVLEYQVEAAVEVGELGQADAALGAWQEHLTASTLDRRQAAHYHRLWLLASAALKRARRETGDALQLLRELEDEVAQSGARVRSDLVLQADMLTERALALHQAGNLYEARRVSGLAVQAALMTGREDRVTYASRRLLRIYRGGELPA